jgi:uncharacterized protein (DUF433 family)
MTITDIGTLIERTPGYNGGKATMAGCGTSVNQVAIMHGWGLSFDEMLVHLPRCRPEHVHAALAYYFANRALTEAEIDAADAYARELQRMYPNGMDANSRELPDVQPLP